MHIESKRGETQQVENQWQYRQGGRKNFLRSPPCSDSFIRMPCTFSLLFSLHSKVMLKLTVTLWQSISHCNSDKWCSCDPHAGKGAGLSPANILTIPTATSCEDPKLLLQFLIYNCSKTAGLKPPLPQWLQVAQNCALFTEVQAGGSETLRVGSNDFSPFSEKSCSNREAPVIAARLRPLEQDSLFSGKEPLDSFLTVLLNKVSKIKWQPLNSRFGFAFLSLVVHFNMLEMYQGPSPHYWDKLLMSGTSEPPGFRLWTYPMLHFVYSISEG